MMLMKTTLHLILLLEIILSARGKKHEPKTPRRRKNGNCIVSGDYPDPIFIQSPKFNTDDGYKGKLQCSISISFKKNHYMNVQIIKLIGINTTQVENFNFAGNEAGNYSFYNMSKTNCSSNDGHALHSPYYMTGDYATFEFDLKNNKNGIKLQLEVTYQQCMPKEETNTTMTNASTSPTSSTTTTELTAETTAIVDNTTTSISTEFPITITIDANTTSTTATPSANTTISNSNNAGSASSGSNLRIIVPVVLAVVILTLNIIACALYVRKRNQKTNPLENDEVDQTFETATNHHFASVQSLHGEDNVYHTIETNSGTVTNEVYNMDRQQKMDVHEETENVLYATGVAETPSKNSQNQLSSSSEEKQENDNVLYSSTSPVEEPEMEQKDNILYSGT